MLVTSRWRKRRGGGSWGGSYVGKHLLTSGRTEKVMLFVPSVIACLHEDSPGPDMNRKIHGHVRSMKRMLLEKGLKCFWVTNRSSRMAKVTAFDLDILTTKPWWPSSTSVFLSTTTIVTLSDTKIRVLLRFMIYFRSLWKMKARSLWQYVSGCLPRNMISTQWSCSEKLLVSINRRKIYNLGVSHFCLSH